MRVVYLILKYEIDRSVLCLYEIDHLTSGENSFPAFTGSDYLSEKKKNSALGGDTLPIFDRSFTRDLLEMTVKITFGRKTYFLCKFIH